MRKDYYVGFYDCLFVCLFCTEKKKKTIPSCIGGFIPTMYTILKIDTSGGQRVLEHTPVGGVCMYVMITNTTSID